MAFLITWVTYNSWLQGDPRGFRTRKGKKHVPPPARYANRESETYDRKQFEKLHKYHLREDAVKLDKIQRYTVADIIVKTIGELCPGEAVISVGASHVHVLVELDGQEMVPRFCNYAKGRSARKLIALGHKGKVWARKYNARHIDTGSWDASRRYVLSHNNRDEVTREIQV